MDYLKTSLIVIALILIINAVGFFAGSETAFLSLSKIKIRQLLSSKRKNSKTVYKLKKNIDELLTIILIGTNFMNSLASALATTLAIQVAGNSGVGIATIAVTCCSTIFGQIVPKTVAVFYPSETACRNSVILLVLEKIFFPIVWLFSKISKFAVFLVMKFVKTDSTLVTEEELKTLIEVGTSEGTLEKNEQVLLNKIFRFSDLTVHDIMKHRSLVKSVSIESSREEIINAFNESGVSRLPVYEKSEEEICGVIYYKAILFSGANESSDEKIKIAEALMTNVLYVPETFSALELLSKFRKEKSDFAVVLDENGCTAGIVTIDDIMRIVFGRMTIEEKSELAPEDQIKFISAKEFIVPGALTIEDVNEILKLNIDSEECVTFGGWIMEKFGYLPVAGEYFKNEGILFVVEEQVQRRVTSVRVKYF